MNKIIVILDSFSYFVKGLNTFLQKVKTSIFILRNILDIAVFCFLVAYDSQ